MNLDRAGYEALDALNWSRLKLIEDSPELFRYGYGDNDAYHFHFGTAGHMAILEPARFVDEYVVWEGDRRKKGYKEFEIEAVRNGKEVLTTKEHATVLAVQASVRAKPRAMHYLTQGAAEQAMIWNLSSWKCKGRADWIGPNAIVDVKTTASAEPTAFAWSAKKYGYFGQAAWYSDGHFMSTGVRLPYVIVAVEKTAPYMVGVYTLPESALEFGRDQYRSLLGKLDYCNKNNWWSGYTEAEETELEVPNWRSN